MKQYEKINHIIDNYINGNIAYTKAEIKKLTKQQRKEVYVYAKEALNPEDSMFFFKLI